MLCINSTNLSNVSIVYYLILLLISLGLLAAVAEAIRQWWLRQKVKNGELSEMPTIQENAAAGCCGLHETCEVESLLAGVSKDIEYYEDEELDRFKGRSGKDYNDDEIEEFTEVLTTLKTEEVAGWIRSLQLREVNLPIELKDDIILLVGEQRELSHNS